MFLFIHKSSSSTCKGVNAFPIRARMGSKVQKYDLPSFLFVFLMTMMLCLIIQGFCKVSFI